MFHLFWIYVQVGIRRRWQPGLFVRYHSNDIPFYILHFMPRDFVQAATGNAYYL